MVRVAVYWPPAVTCIVNENRLFCVNPCHLQKSLYFCYSRAYLTNTPVWPGRQSWVPEPIVGWEQLLGHLGIIMREMESRGWRTKNCRALRLVYQFIWQRLEPSQEKEVKERTGRSSAGGSGITSGSQAAHFLDHVVISCPQEGEPPINSCLAWI